MLGIMDFDLDHGCFAFSRRLCYSVCNAYTMCLDARVIGGHHTSRQVNSGVGLCACASAFPDRVQHVCVCVCTRSVQLVRIKLVAVVVAHFAPCCHHTEFPAVVVMVVNESEREVVVDVVVV